MRLAVVNDFDTAALFIRATSACRRVTRDDMRAAGWSPSVRLFEAAACRTPAISDNWEGLDTLFPPRTAIIIARGPHEVVHTLERVSEAERKRMGEAAFDIVKRDHTGFARARSLAEILLPASSIMSGPAVVSA